MKIETGSLKKGDFILHQNEVWQVQKTEFSFQGRGMAVVRTKLKNTVSGKNIDMTFKSVAQVDKADVNNVEMQYLYDDGQNLHFMNERSYNQVSLSKTLTGEVSAFLKEGQKYFLLVYEDKPLALRLPPSIKLQVTAAQEAVKGNTVTGAKKPVQVETGATVMAPLFIKKGDFIVVNPQTGQYVERVKA